MIYLNREGMLELRPSHLDSTSYCFTSTLYSHSGSIPNPQRKGKSSKKSLFFVFLPSQFPPIIDVISFPTWWLHFEVSQRNREERSRISKPLQAPEWKLRPISSTTIYFSAFSLFFASLLFWAISFI